MKPTPRWIAPLLAEAAACKTHMPWERGLRRAALIARRKSAAPQPPRQTEPLRISA